MERKVKESLKHLEYHFFTAINNNWRKALKKSDKELLAKVYKELTGEVYIRLNCYECMSEIVKVVGIEYFKEDIETVSEPIVEAETIVEPIKEETNGESNERGYGDEDKLSNQSESTGVIEG